VRTFVVLAAAFVLFSVWQHHRREQNEGRLALAASALAEREVRVGCPGFWTRLVEITPYSGWVSFDEHGLPADETTLSASTCRSLEKLWRSAEPPSFTCLESASCTGDEVGIVNGLVTLAHESWHLRGVRREAQTQCYALQTTELAARLLGIAPEEARRVAAYAATRDTTLPFGEYRSAECRPGGAFDLRPQTLEWPG